MLDPKLIASITHKASSGLNTVPCGYVDRAAAGNRLRGQRRCRAFVLEDQK